MAHSTHSRFAQRVRRRHAGELHLLPPGPLDLAAMEQVYLVLLQGGLRPDQALRVLRQLVLERLLTLDCDDNAPLSLITGSMTTLAEFALDVACTQAFLTLDAQHGVPTTEQGRRAQLWIVGMGKLGARELNVSSDIDLIYVYEQDGDTTGDEQGLGRVSNQEYFAKVVRIIHSLLGEVSDHGFVFRLDLALRPNGNAGPSVVSLSALEEYFHVQGREWERFAWLKSRVVAPVQNMHNGSGQALRNLVIPFVFRRYLDYSVFEALRVLHRQIREHANRRSAGRPERHNDVKLSRGGIREIEFTVQLLQVVRAGQYPELRTRPTLSALQRLARAGLMHGPTAEALAQAYVFLRQVEHRIQYLDDQQTHVLPHQDGDLDWIAHSLGFAASGPFLTQLDMHREVVAHEFDQLLGAASAQDCKGCGAASKGAPFTPNLDELLAQLPPQFAERVMLWREHPRVLALSDASRGRLLRLLARTAQWLRSGQVSETSAVRLADWMEPLLRRENYLALLLERPQVHERLMRLLGVARWPARYLQLHPGVIDELASDTMLHERFAANEFEAELEHRRQALRAAGEDDDESLLNLLRRAHHAEVFSTLARDLEGTITEEQVADDLSALAEAVLRVTTRWCWDRLKKKHRPDPQLAILAYGKLGGKELGYGSDLDVVFVFEDADEQAPEVYATLVRKLIHWLTLKTGHGDLYEIDTALRPNGNSGLLITSFTAYANYQQQRGSNTAWTWEHQAMTRARCVLGSESLRQRFDVIRQTVVMARREPLALRQEIMAMREKVRAAHPVRGVAFDVKHSAGGMVDVEFAVQFLVLSQAADHPALSANMGNIALLKQAQIEGLLPQGVGEAAARAYRELRRVQHRARLDEVPTQVAPQTVLTERQAVLNLWAHVFER
jgi:[glutamine synthetase] adenylyltransferase / [glutamine synthetase]-adenylyl-L-tyrosine phosphorylase